MMEHPFHDAVQCRERLKARRYSVQTRDSCQFSNELMHISKIVSTKNEGTQHCSCL